MSRLLIAIAFLWCTASVANATLIMTGGNQLIGAQGGKNQFGNLSGDYRTFNQPFFTSFPATGSATATAVAANASLTYAYTQIGDYANLTQEITQFREGVQYGQAEHRFTIEFTAINDLNFKFTSNYNGLGSAGVAQYHVFLFDQSTLGNVFSDNSEDPSDTMPVETHFGQLKAGHKYSLNGTSRLYAGDVPSPYAASATGTYVFTTSPLTAVPEPSTIFLLSSGAICYLGRRRLRKRQS